MKLEKFKERDKKKIGIIIFTVCCIFLIAGVFLYKTFASFEVKNNFNVIEGTVQDPGDIYFTFFVNDQISKTMPNKESGYVFDAGKSNCTNGASPEFNGNDWSVKINNLTVSRTKCMLYFKDRPTMSDDIIELAKTDTTNLAYDNTQDNNLRYIGANPNNYVSFNGEKWRIIGVMNKNDGRVKIIRDGSIGDFSWNNTNSNRWEDAAIMKLLNPGYEYESIGGSLYYNRRDGGCYTGENGYSEECDFTSNGLSDEAKDLISDARWGTGDFGHQESYTTMNSEGFYSIETNTGEWDGQVGLMTPSDYGYATSGGATTSKDACLSEELAKWGSLNDCKNNSWLSNYANWQATMVNAGSDMIYLNANGTIMSESPNQAYAIVPVVYLKPNVVITGGDGTSGNPYQIALK